MSDISTNYEPNVFLYLWVAVNKIRHIQYKRELRVLREIETFHKNIYGCIKRIQYSEREKTKQKQKYQKMTD